MTTYRRYDISIVSFSVSYQTESVLNLFGNQVTYNSYSTSGLEKIPEMNREIRIPIIYHDKDGKPLEIGPRTAYPGVEGAPFDEDGSPPGVTLADPQGFTSYPFSGIIASTGKVLNTSHREVIEIDGSTSYQTTFSRKGEGNGYYFVASALETKVFDLSPPPNGEFEIHSFSAIEISNLSTGIEGAGFSLDFLNPFGWLMEDFTGILEAPATFSIAFPDYIWLEVTSSLFTNEADRVDLLQSIDQFYVSDMNALGGNDRVVLPSQSIGSLYDFSQIFHAGEGNDTIIGRDGNDQIAGDAGRDRLAAGAGNDELFGGYGRDRLHGGQDNDTLSGDANSDTLIGGTGTDTLFGGTGDDFIYIGREDTNPDRSERSGGHALFGGDGNDVLNAWGAKNALRDELTGGAGADIFQVRGGDFIADFTAEDSIWMLDARQTDWMVAKREDDSTVTLRFHNRDLGLASTLELAGDFQPRGFYATAPSLGGFTEIRYAAPVAATRTEALSLSQALLKSLDNLQDDIIAEGYVLSEKVAADWIADRIISNRSRLIDQLENQIGREAAEKLADYMVGKAFDYGDALTKVANGTATRKDGWALLQEASIDVLKALVPKKFEILVDLGVSGLTVGSKVFERAVDIMMNSFREDLLYQAELALEDRSVIIVRSPPPPAAPIDPDWLM